MPRHQLLEILAWNTLDKYIRDNPKPRMSARFRHRCKLWLIQYISEHVALEGLAHDYITPLDQHRTDQMLDYAQRTLNQD
jgi:hypothetical protein